MGVYYNTHTHTHTQTHTHTHSHIHTHTHTYTHTSGILGTTVEKVYSKPKEKEHLIVRACRGAQKPVF